MQEGEAAHYFFQFSKQSTRVTMKVNGNLWTLGPCLVGDGTSAQPTWGVNSLWSNLKNENNYILYLMNLIHGHIYTSII